MIVIDSSERRSSSRCPEIEGAVVSGCLEETCGADVMVSLKKYPVSSPTLIRKHVEAGAILIQLKFSSDLIGSIADERVNIALARMIEAGTKHPWQRVVLGCGCYLPNLKTGKVMVGRVVRQQGDKVIMTWRSSEPEIDYRALATIRRRIGMRGGTFVNLTCEEELPGELHAMESDLAYLSKFPRKELLHLPQFPPDPPDPTDPLQTPIEVKDARVVIAAFRGIGPRLANDLWDALREHNERMCAGTDVNPEPSLMQALSWLCESDRKWVAPKKIPGWGKGRIDMVREQLGLLDGHSLTVRVDEQKEN